MPFAAALLKYQAARKHLNAMRRATAGTQRHHTRAFACTALAQNSKQLLKLLASKSIPHSSVATQKEMQP